MTWMTTHIRSCEHNMIYMIHVHVLILSLKASARSTSGLGTPSGSATILRMIPPPLYLCQQIRLLGISLPKRAPPLSSLKRTMKHSTLHVLPTTPTTDVATSHDFPPASRSKLRNPSFASSWPRAAEA